MTTPYRFSFGPWNIHEGADPFGPPTRPGVPFLEKLAVYKELGFDGVQFHDDDVVADIDDKSPREVEAAAEEMRRRLDDHGLVAEFVAPRLWEDPRGVDGAFTADDPKVRAWASARTERCLDVCRAMNTKLTVFWFAREGTYLREAKDAVVAYERLLEAINHALAYDADIEIAIEPKPNEPMDQAYVPTVGHALALGQASRDPARVGGLIETAHALLAGLDPSDEIAFALSMNKLMGVHLNDQNGLKYDQDKTFGSANLRAAFNQVRVLERADYASSGRFIGLDVKAMRTTKPEHATKHLANSKRVFELLVAKARSFDHELERKLIAERDHETLERVVLEHLLGRLE